MKFIFIICFSFFNFFPANFTAKGAEKINIIFEGMSIPISIDELSNLNVNNDNSIELINWLRNNGLKDILQLSRYLEFPVFKEDGISKQILRSWMGRKVLSELSNTFIVPNDSDGIELFNSIERLLEQKKEVSTLDILREIPFKEIRLDLDNLINIVTDWKKALDKEMYLTRKLNLINSDENKINYIFNYEKEFNSFSRKISLNVSHRDDPLSLEIWIPNINHSKDLIIFMPGLGGDISNFRWIGSGLSERGWPVILIEHQGSNSEALNAAFKGSDSLPGGADIFLYRLKDLDAVINEFRKGSLSIKSKSYILMGHSLGSLISFLYEGNPPSKDFESICQKSLNDFALTNLSKLLQCQLLEIPLPKFNKSSDLKAIIGFNSFGSLIWPNKNSLGIDVPLLFIGGTFDLITPLASEQFNVFFANESNKLNRFLIIEDASHFSPIRVINNSSMQNIDNDVFKIKENLIGVNPYNFQKLSINIITQFLKDLDQNKGLNIIKKYRFKNLYLHLFGEKELKNIYKN